jgi:hypothetical protein
MNAADLTTLADLKNFISPAVGASTASDTVFAKIITAVSLGINRHLSRTLAVAQRSEVRNGNGQPSIRALVYPIVSVTSVVIAPFAGTPGTTITPPANPATQLQSLSWDQWFIYLVGNCFERGKQNVTLNYTGGFITPGQLQLLTLAGWTAGGTVTQNQQIQVGSYYYQAVNSGTSGAAPGPTWEIITNSVTNDNGVLWLCLGPMPIYPPNASLVPDDITEACLEQCSLLFKNRTRVGDTGMGLGPDRVNYFLKDAHPSTIEKIRRHREVFPIDGMGVQ